MNERLQQFLNAENITQAQFADSIKVARAGVSHIIAGRNKPGWDFIINTMERYPDLNIEWLLTGKGKMYKTSARRSEKAGRDDKRSMQYDGSSLFSFDDDPEGTAEASGRRDGTKTDPDGRTNRRDYAGQTSSNDTTEAREVRNGGINGPWHKGEDAHNGAINGPWNAPETGRNGSDSPRTGMASDTPFSSRSGNTHEASAGHDQATPFASAQTVRQRRIFKIIAFFDDGTFQELQ